MTRIKVATIIGKSERTVKTYCKLYRESSLDGLSKNSPGRNVQLTKEQQDAHKQTIIFILARKLD
ncbi:hypothetical protein [Paenibacillus sp. MER TA 81-3]|uniref:hypothetical protein n=1 Tax=Paenibacillus sp. MER TA 81-3 TaxID=2939573 RepID=UPI00203D53B3|nr:hypothetical protein [Paenibacillus sp. MER TA 81-3]